MPYLSIVSPVYQAEKIVDKLVSEIIKSVSAITDDFEIILVEDGSKDDSWGKIVENCEKDVRVKGIKLSRNFGQHHAITAGLHETSGVWIVVMDCDLQDRPEEIINMYNKCLDTKSDVCFARRVNRKDSFFKIISSKFFNFIMKLSSGLDLVEGTGNFGIFSKKVILAYRRMNESRRGFRHFIVWIGFKQTFQEVEHSTRKIGRSTYNFSKSFELAINLLVGFSDRPLKLLVLVGFIFSLLSCAYAMYWLAIKSLGYTIEAGFTSLIFSIWFVGSIIVFSIGMVGLYISRIQANTNSRPIYIIDKTQNICENGI
jgi:glycosyltransferase involved in cell wall biosynthesis